VFELDCKLLSIFYYVYKFKNVSQAADHLDMSQPAVSNLLNKIAEPLPNPMARR